MGSDPVHAFLQSPLSRWLQVEDPRGLMHDGTVVKYGDEVLLVDEEDSVMCHFRGRKYIRRKQRGTKGVS
eukprot:24329-Eustigmatos_ZCMA.PRE.1